MESKGSPSFVINIGRDFKKRKKRITERTRIE